MNKRFYDFFNYGSLIVVFILLILMLTKSVPTEWFVTIASFAILLLVVRIILRIYITAKNRNKTKE